MGVKSGGCSGLSYTLDRIAEKVVDDDSGSTGTDVDTHDHVERFPEEGLEFRIDPKALLYLVGLELDYDHSLIGGGFKFTNPNASKSCSCGISFAVPKAHVSTAADSQSVIEVKPKRCS
eukprot:Selendium_serpulae@DN5537_c0_g1_i2.p2